MQILILSGGIEGGNTDLQCEGFVDVMEEFGHDVVLVRYSDFSPVLCNGCERCKEKGECCYDDGFDSVIDIFDKSDVIVFATPIRFNGPSAQIKALMERFQVVWNNMNLAERRKRLFCSLTNCGSDRDDSGTCDIIFKSFALSFGGEWIGSCFTKGTDKSIDNLKKDAEEFAEKVHKYSKSL